MSRIVTTVLSLFTLLAVLGASACAQSPAQAPASAADAGASDDEGDEDTAETADDGTEEEDDAPDATPTPAKQLEKFSKSVDKALAAAQTGDLVKAKSEYVKAGERWTKAEPTVKSKSAEAQTAIGGAMQEVQAALVAEASPNKDKALAALQKLRQTIDQQKPKLA